MLRRVKTKFASLIVVVLFAAFAWTFVKRPLPVPEVAGPVLPDAVAVEGVSFSMIRGAEMRSQEGFSVRGGSLMKRFITAIGAFVVEHPRGMLLIDAGVGREVTAHLGTTPLLMRALAELTVRQATIDALSARGFEPSDLGGIVLTHSHWDHVSGLADLRSVPVWITPEELAYARSDDEGETVPGARGCRSIRASRAELHERPLRPIRREPGLLRRRERGARSDAGAYAGVSRCLRNRRVGQTRADHRRHVVDERRR